MKPCTYCGKEFERRKNERIAQFERRAFCSVSCSVRARHHVEEAICVVDGCDRPVHVKKRGECQAHYEAGRRLRKAAARAEGRVLTLVVDEDPPWRRPPVRCAFCAAHRILLGRGASDAEIAAVMRKPVAWIKDHIEKCDKKEKAA